MLIFIITLVILIILFSPIPIKLSLKYIDKKFSIYIYNKKLSSSKKNKKKQKESNKNQVSKDIFNMIEKFSHFKFKPKLNLDISMNLGFEDASITALGYGTVNVLVSFFLIYLKRFFRVKKSNIKIMPNFKIPQLNIEINSIFFVNLLTIIYILFIYLKEQKKS